MLDTNIVIALLQGADTVLSNLDQAPEVFIPAVALGELFFGAAKSSRPSENTAKVERFATGRAIISCDLDVAREYGRLKQTLKEKGPWRNITGWSSLPETATSAKCRSCTPRNREPTDQD